jgi:hypothetical protein
LLNQISISTFTFCGRINKVYKKKLAKNSRKYIITEILLCKLVLIVVLTCIFYHSLVKSRRASMETCKKSFVERAPVSHF